VFVIDLVRCKQSRRRPVNICGEHCAELDYARCPKEREMLLLDGSAVAGERPWPRSAAALAVGEKKTRQDTSGRVGEDLDDIQHPFETDRSEEMGRFVFFE
jgi:hypothetical protein